MRAVDAVYRVIYYNSEILYVAALVCTFLVLITSILLFYLRPRTGGDAGDLYESNAEDFQSISATLYLAMMMLTGQGGPDGPLPWYTKAVVLLTSVFSVAMFAIPASMLTWGFEAEAARMAKLAHRRRAQAADGGESGRNCDAVAAKALDWDSDDESGYSTDEEYFRIIAGEESDDDSSDDEEESELIKALKDGFRQGDSDQDGTLSLAEFVRLQTTGAAGRPEFQHNVINRVEALEKSVKANSDKLDRILELLQGNNNK